MTKQDLDHLSWDEWDEVNDPRPANFEFDKVVEEAISRRGFLSGIVAFGSGAAVMGSGLLNSTAAHAMGHSGSRFAFDPIGIFTDNTVHVPEGYSWSNLASWGDPLFSDAPVELDQAIGGSVESSDRIFGENTDGMELFNINGHEVIAVNHEYVNKGTNLPATGGDVNSAEDVRKLQNLQGVTVMEVARGEAGWEVVVDSPFNRRIHHNTEMRIAGPAAGHPLLQTAADPEGMTVLGTLNNCGAGRTPWGTYLTCEENFNGYFGSTDEGFELPEGYDRYGIGLEGRYNYEGFDPRFDVSQNPNEPHRFGYIVEIDPADPTSTPVKRTALGRFKHENAACALAPDGRVVVYLGDDERGEYLYRYVSNGVYQPGGDTDHLLDDGTLYVARFDTDGTGEWVELSEENTGMNDVETRIFTRMAASAAGGTTMDRPEWVAVNPNSVEAYCALTNNSRRAPGWTNRGGDLAEPVVGSPNPRAENRYGQIVRWFPSNDDHAADLFRWDLYVMAGNPGLHSDAYAGSGNIHMGNLFNSPDGMMFDSAGILWIQTDGNDSNEEGYVGMGNNQMLAGDPETGEIVRFLTAPNGAEVTGITWSSDRRTMFVGIQHPDAPFPDGEGMLPRSTVVAVWRNDGGLVG